MQWEGARNTAANGEAVRQTPAHAVPRGVRAVTETVGPGRPVHFPREQTGGADFSFLRLQVAPAFSVSIRRELAEFERKTLPW